MFTLSLRPGWFLRTGFGRLRQVAPGDKLRSHCPGDADKKGQTNIAQSPPPRRAVLCLIGPRNPAQHAVAMDLSALNRASPARVEAVFLCINLTLIVRTVEVLASVRKAILASSPLIATYVMAAAGPRALPSLIEQQ